MALNAKLLEILCCPVSLRPLELLGEQKLMSLNKLINQGLIHTVDGTTVDEPFEQALVTDDGRVIYPIEDRLPNLLPQSGVGTAQLKDAL